MRTALEARVTGELASGHAGSRGLRRVSGGRFPHVIMDGREVLNLSSNNYLGLAEDPRVTGAAIDALTRGALGLACGRRSGGTAAVHVDLEHQLATWGGFETALLFNSTFMANVGLLTAVLREGDVVYSDELNHASIIDGCRASKARIEVYGHRDTADLERRLTARSPTGLNLVITDGVFSMEGDTAPLEELAELRRRHGVALAVDDAHGIGILGATGAGTIEHCRVTGEVDIQIGTLGKALGGALGGYVAGSRALTEYLTQRARNFIFTNPVPPSVAAGSRMAVDIARQEPQRRARLRANTDHLRCGLRECGFSLGGGATPIVPVLIGDEARARQLSELLFEGGLFVQAYTFPVVPRGAARLRCIVSAAHSTEDLERAIRTFDDARRRLTPA